MLDVREAERDAEAKAKALIVAKASDADLIKILSAIEADKLAMHLLADWDHAEAVHVALTEAFKSVDKAKLDAWAAAHPKL
jgi:hypothetical protein